MRAPPDIGGEFPLDPRQITRRTALSGPGAMETGTWLTSGRAAIRLAIQRTCAGPPGLRHALLPAYLCASVLQPFRDAGVPVVFYRVDDRLNVDLEDLSARLTGDTAAVVVINYFGTRQPPAVFDVLRAADPPVAVIDDVSHSWLSDAGMSPPVLPRLYRVCSPRKVGALPDGGIIVNTPDDRAAGAPLEPPHPVYVVTRTLGLCFRWCFQRTGARSANRTAYWLLTRAERLLDHDTRVRRGSQLSKRLISRWPLRAIAERRRANFEVLATGLPAMTDRVRAFVPTLPAGAVPLGFPIVVRERDRVKQGLIARGIYPPVHWALPPEPGIAGFPHLVDLSNQILTIPIDQRYGPGDMSRVLEALEACTA